jgi:hypothetical protein
MTARCVLMASIYALTYIIDKFTLHVKTMLLMSSQMSLRMLFRLRWFKLTNRDDLSVYLFLQQWLGT